MVHYSISYLGINYCLLWPCHDKGPRAEITQTPVEILENALAHFFFQPVFNSSTRFAWERRVIISTHDIPAVAVDSHRHYSLTTL